MHSLGEAAIRAAIRTEPPVRRPARRPRPLGGLLACAIAGAILTGCSGDEDDRARSEFVRQAEAACRKLNERAERLKAATDDAELARYLDRLVPLLEELARRQGKLSPPADLQQDWKRFRELDEQSREATVAFREAARSGDGEALERDGGRAEELDTRYDEAASRLGLRECAADPMPAG